MPLPVWSDAEVKACYYGMISLIDKNIGRLIDALRKQDWLENAIILFTAHRGENLGDHRLLFRGTTCDCVTNVPFIVSWPGNTHPGEVRDLLCGLQDDDLVAFVSPMAGDKAFVRGFQGEGSFRS